MKEMVMIVIDFCVRMEYVGDANFKIFYLGRRCCEEDLKCLQTCLKYIPQRFMN